MTEGPIAELAARLDEIAADVGEHDKTLMAIIRRGARDGAMPVPEPGETAIERQLELVDRAGAVYEKHSSAEKRLFDALLKSSLERRRHLAYLLSLPDDDREAVAFILSLDERQRAELAQHAEKPDGDGTEDA
jgi:hypothetical protein